jgi:hypothetical protein
MGARRKHFDWLAMQAHIDAGNGFLRCRRRFGIAYATWKKAIAAGDIRVDTTTKAFLDAHKRYDWNAIRAFYEEGATYRTCRQQFGFSSETWARAVRQGRIVPRRPWTAEEALLYSRSRRTVKNHLLRAGILRNRCDWCGLTAWRGRPIAIQIDHVNGVRDDHRLENLRMLCPNCHSQTDTFAARNRSIRKRDPS